MMKKITFFIVLLVVATVQAQKITVVDFDTRLPVQNCTIYNDDGGSFVVTNKEGIADITIFKENDIIYFNHISYIEIERLKRQITSDNQRLFLHKRAESLDEVVLSVSRKKESLSRIAEHVDISHFADIKRVAPQTSADLLAKLPGIKVQKPQAGGGSPVLRGMEAIEFYWL